VPAWFQSYAAGRRKTFTANRGRLRFHRYGLCERPTRCGPNLRSTALRSVAEDRIVLGPTSKDARECASGPVWSRVVGQKAMTVFFLIE